eukprot:m.213496 g.213496  ORF g.213496 m.213496 type:complete len:252 (-) comp26172_c0_seq1:616-1371(-)
MIIIMKWSTCRIHTPSLGPFARSSLARPIPHKFFKQQPSFVPLNAGSTSNNDSAPLKLSLATPSPFGTLGVCTMIRDRQDAAKTGVTDSKYLHEWIAFHEMQGFSSFTIYNDQGYEGDAISQVLRPFIARGLVELVEVWPPNDDMMAREPGILKAAGVNEHEVEVVMAQWRKCHDGEGRGGMYAQAPCQQAAFLDCIARKRNQLDWAGLFDLDEFFFAPAYETFAEYLNKLTREGLKTDEKEWEKGRGESD